jgi:hypothetical protein
MMVWRSLMLGPFCGSLLLAPWGGTTPELGVFGGFLVLAPWGWTLGRVLCVRTPGLIPCIRTLVLDPCVENSSRKSDI